MTQNTGGPAFPTENERQTGKNSYYYEGMSLRDYFAAKAMQGLVPKCLGSNANATDIAETSYAIADATLTERNKEK